MAGPVLELDWVKLGAIIVSIATGMEKMAKVYRLWKAASHNQAAAVGLTVKNGEYVSIVRTLGRIERRLDHVVTRVETIEERLST